MNDRDFRRHARHLLLAWIALIALMLASLGSAYVPLGMYDQPMAFYSYLQDVRDGWPQFYGVRRV